MRFLNCVIYSAVLVIVIACSSTTRYEKGCCTTTIIYNYCQESKDKLASILESKPKEQKHTKWGSIIIPAPSRVTRSSEPCVSCEIPFIECVQHYNDYAFEHGFDILEYEQLMVDGKETFGY